MSPTSSVIFARFDDSLDCHRALNRPAVAVEVAVDAFDLVALVRVEHGVLLVLLPPLRRADRLGSLDRRSRPLATRGIERDAGMRRHVAQSCSANGIATRNTSRRSLRMTAKSWCTQ